MVVHNMSQQEGSASPLQRLHAKCVEARKPLSFFVTTTTRQFFHILGLRGTFLSFPPVTWKDRPDYKPAESIVTALRVVSDAERDVKLIQDYNLILTNDEEQ